MSLQEQDNQTAYFHAESKLHEQHADVDENLPIYESEPLLDDAGQKPTEISAELKEYRVLRSHLNKGRIATKGYTADSTTAFLDEIGRFSLLDGREEEAKLAVAIEIGREAASKLADEPDISDEEKNRLELQISIGEMSKERFLMSNIRLVVSIAKNYNRPPSVELTDLIQEGILGLEHAIEKFDHKRGFRFSTYSSNWIKQHITRFLALRAQSVKVPDKEFSQLRRALIDSNNNALTELPDKQLRLMSLMNQMSLDMPVGDGDSELIDILDSQNEGPEAIVAESNSREAVHQIIEDVLNPRERAWLTMYYGLDGEESMTLTKIANLSGVSHQTVKTCISKAKEKLRNNDKFQELR